MSAALARATVAQRAAHQKLADLGMELTDARGRRLETGSMNIERTQLEERVQLYES